MRTNQPARISASARPHVCGCYYVVQDRSRVYLPRLSLNSHTTISSLYFSTKLTQTFQNPNEECLTQVRFAFPLYDGVMVNGYTISYAGKKLMGVVKQKDDAKQAYQEAVDRGETAGLLEALPAGIFGVSLGNVPPKASIIVEMTYCGELKHDAAVDGLRYTLPTSIAPRYGSYPGKVLQTNAVVGDGGIAITVDIDTSDAPIRRVQSPSHPIAVSMGQLSSPFPDRSTAESYMPSQASATLTLGTAELDGDFILQVVVDRICEPQAIIEKHPTLPNQRAIMATAVPKFALKSDLPEIVFIADQSGSMRSGGKNEALKASLKVFLKSLPLGVRFNICAFGNLHQFLWPKSMAYGEQNLDAALAFVDTFDATMGGTEILGPITDTFKNRLGDLPLEVMLLTDGEVWGEDAVFKYINDQIHDLKVDARVFALGIGADVSHTLVEGVARAGNGFAQFVSSEHTGFGLSEPSSYEALDQKVVRMLKAALYAHTSDYQLDIHYEEDDNAVDAEEFELVDKVSDCLVIEDEVATVFASEDTQPKSFFDSSMDLDAPPKLLDKAMDRYAHLPVIPPPKILQAPTTIPPLFPFNRSTIYLLLGPEAGSKAVRSVTLHASSAQGPLRLDIPVRNTGGGKTIHQLAARKAIQDLEESRGWIQSATSGGADKQPVRAKYASRLDEMVEREAVRLGEMFQVASRWTSFVAVEEGAVDAESQARKAEVTIPLSEPRLQMASMQASQKMKSSALARTTSSFQQQPQSAAFQPAPLSSLASRPPPPFASAYQPPPPSASASQSPQPFAPAAPYSSGVQPFGQMSNFSGQSPMVRHGPLFAAMPPPPPMPNPYQNSLFGASTGYQQQQQQQQQQCLPMNRVAKHSHLSTTRDREREIKDAGSVDIHVGARPARLCRVGLPGAERLAPASSDTSDENINKISTVAKMHQLIDMQTFSGAWKWESQLLQQIGVAEDAKDKDGPGGADVAATLLVIAYFENNLADQTGAWEMVIQKAKAWVHTTASMSMAEVDARVQKAASSLQAQRQA